MKIELMSLAKAKIEANRRWPALGGWADIKQAPHSDLPDVYAVGIRRDLHGMTTRVTLGRSTKSFERAFAAADKAEERMRKPHTRKPRVPHPKALPQEKLPL